MCLKDGKRTSKFTVIPSKKYVPYSGLTIVMVKSGKNHQTELKLGVQPWFPESLDALRPPPLLV